jgi:hypothetical protein
MNAMRRAPTLTVTTAIGLAKYQRAHMLTDHPGRDPLTASALYEWAITRNLIL